MELAYISAHIHTFKKKEVSEMIVLFMGGETEAWGKQKKKHITVIGEKLRILTKSFYLSIFGSRAYNLYYYLSFVVYLKYI